jgi:hypothetical protein
MCDHSLPASAEGMSPPAPDIAVIPPAIRATIVKINRPFRILSSLLFTVSDAYAARCGPFPKKTYRRPNQFSCYRTTDAGNSGSEFSSNPFLKDNKQKRDAKLLLPVAFLFIFPFIEILNSIYP